MSVAELVALGGLGVSIVAILAQLRSVGRQLFVQNFAEHNRRYGQILDRLPRQLLNADFKLADTDPAIREEAVRGLWAYFDLCFEQWFLADNRLVGRRLSGMWEAGLKASMSRPPFQEGWVVIKQLTTYPNEFQQYVERLRTADTR
jgi:hypothetical protein